MKSKFSTPHRRDTDVDISSVGFWSRRFDERDQAFARLRAEAPVSWHPPLETSELPKRYREAGFWAVTRAADIVQVSRRHDLFSSQIGQVSVRPRPFLISPNMLVMDPPLHTAYRQAFSKAFTPAAVASLQPRINRRARQIVLRAARLGEFDLVDAISGQVPLRTLADLIGVPPEEQDEFVVAADCYVRTRMPTELPAGMSEEDFISAQGTYLRRVCDTLAFLRRRAPASDLMTRLVELEIDGRALSEEEIWSAVVLLIVAGHDTTKQMITLVCLALSRHPEQLNWLRADVDRRFEQAFDELARFTSPIISFARTATTDVELGGKVVTAGDKVAMFYCSGNRDESLFPDPAALDLTRPRSQHVAFGGGGIHYCLGTSLARVQLQAVLGQLFTRMPNLVLGEPVFGFSDAIYRVDSLPASVE